MIRFVELLKGINYCFSSAKTLNVVKGIPPLLVHHPTVHTVIVHVGMNDIKVKQSTKLQENFELLAETIESPGKLCFFSGLIQTPKKGCE